MVEHGWIEAISKAKRWLNIMAGEIALFSLSKKAAFLKKFPLYPELRDDLFRRRQKLLGFRCRNSEFDIPENALSRLNRVHFGSLCPSDYSAHFVRCVSVELISFESGAIRRHPFAFVRHLHK